jgi:predicted enzyme related to lactoylglutathione lyase
MTKQTEYPDGAPCWADLSTPDLAGAQRFYGGLLGWSFDAPETEMGNYVMCRRDGKTVAGMAPKQPGMDMPTVWSVYLMSRDVDALARKIEAGGGKLMMPPMDIPPSGRMLFGFDPTGAAFGAWQPQQHRGAELFGAPGGMAWNEVNTRDAAAADAFYRGLFHYEQQQIGDLKTFDYTVWNIDGKPVCGRMLMDKQWEGIPPHWMTYFAVEDCDKGVEMVRELGGKVMHGPFDSPHGRIAVVSDPHGATFSIIDMSKTITC